MSDDLEYIRRAYGVPAYKGVKVDTGRIGWGVGRITGTSGPYLKINFGGRGTHIFHPTDGITYLIEQNNSRPISDVESARR